MRKITIMALAFISAAANADPDQGIVGSIGRAKLTESEVIAADKGEFDRLKRNFEVQQRQLEAKFEESRHNLLQKQLDAMLDKSALDLEAKDRRVAPAAVLAELKLKTPTEDESRAFYEANKERINAPYEQVAPKLREYLAAQTHQVATRNFYDALRVKHDISSTLGPYRRSVAASGPARGNGSAVTIVEFGDFQCPYCREAETSLRSIMAKYPHDVRLIFRNLPLAQIHPNARIAAESAVCAERQGQFWEMHDAMYADQSALNPDALKTTAKRLGLNPDQFGACLTDGSTGRELDADAKAAQELGLDGTPSFFINGRPLEGDVPLEKFDGIISDELRAHARNAAGRFAPAN